ncbi:hypothetical protein Ancab_024571 [Ancistrocladus abbreviatus]
MSDSTSEAGNRKTSRCRKNSPSIEEASSGGNSSGGGPLKKGPWTSAEDAILVEYVSRYGEGNWNAVQKYSGLLRCGKSCRLRWANHLRPDLKKGAFTSEEERRIIELHAKMGNKWARMATELPGRTDNEIKNFWNTRIKRLQRAGLPIYPPEIRVQALNECQQSEESSRCRTGKRHWSDASPSNDFDIPDVECKILELDKGLLDRPPSLFDIPASSILHKSVNSSQGFGSFFPTMYPHTRLNQIETPFHGPVGSNSSPFLSFDLHEDDTFGKHAQPFWSSCPYDADLSISDLSPIDVLNGSHAPINGNSSSEPIPVAMKSELPSLQYSESLGGSWVTPSSPLPSLESVDTLIQSPISGQTQSDWPSPRSSGLLEAIVYESQSLKNSKNRSDPYISETSLMAGDVTESSSQNICETKWGACVDPVSPLSQSAASVNIEYAPVSRSSSDEPQPTETMPGGKIRPKVVDLVSAKSDGKEGLSLRQLEYLRPDVLLDSYLFGHHSGHSKDLPLAADVGELLGDDLSCESKQVGALPAGSNQSCGTAASAWHNTFAAYQLSKDH